jgi:hypothetical protein
VEVAPRYAVLLSWTLPALLFVAIVNLGVVRRAVRPTADTRPVSLPSRSRLTRTVLVGNGANIAGIVVAGTLPLLITERFGAEANASYFLAWSMAYVLFLAPRYVSLVVLSRAEHQPEQLDDITLRATLASTALVGVAALVALVLARPVLGMVGSAYQNDAVGLLQLMSLAAVPHCAVVMAAAWARGRQRIALAVVVSIAEYVAMIGFALLFVGRMGVMGFGWAWLAGETLAAVVLAGVAWRTRRIDSALVRNALAARRAPNAPASN